MRYVYRPYVSAQKVSNHDLTYYNASLSLGSNKADQSFRAVEGAYGFRTVG